MIHIHILLHKTPHLCKASISDKHSEKSHVCKAKRSRVWEIYRKKHQENLTMMKEKKYIKLKKNDWFEVQSELMAFYYYSPGDGQVKLSNTNSTGFKLIENQYLPEPNVLTTQLAMHCKSQLCAYGYGIIHTHARANICAMCTPHHTVKGYCCMANW